jgi:hypothetical protein
MFVFSRSFHVEINIQVLVASAIEDDEVANLFAEY